MKQLKTVMRMAMTSNLFLEPKPEKVSHSATSALLVTNSEFHDWAGFMTETTAPAAFKLVEATEKWPEGIGKNETAYNIAFDTDLPFFEHLNTNPQKVKEFAGYMKHVQQSEGTSLRHLVQGFNWAAVGKGKVVDVGITGWLPFPIRLTMSIDWRVVRSIEHRLSTCLSQLGLRRARPPRKCGEWKSNGCSAAAKCCVAHLIPGT